MGATNGGKKQYRNIVYAALPSQEKFHRSTARFKGFSGPIGSGKSQALCNEAIKLSYLNPGRLGLIGAPTYPMLRDATQCAYFEILGANKLPHEFNKAENTLAMKDTGSKILFRSLDDFERLRGTNLAWFGVDELTYCAEEAWLRLEGRLRDPRSKQLCGFGVWTPKGYDWVYRRFIGSPVEGYEAIIARPFENRHLLSRIPDFYERLRSSYDQAFFEQEVLGEYLNVNAGRVYRAFDRPGNVKPGEANPALPLIWALDFNVDPMCSVVAQVAKGTVTVLDEIVLSRVGTSEACQEFETRYPAHAAGLKIYGDASAHHMQSSSGKTDVEIIKAHFKNHGYGTVRIEIPRANPGVRDRVTLVNAALQAADGSRRMWIHPQCKELIRDLEEVVYQPGTAMIDKTSDPKRTHLSDALGYLVWQELRTRKQMGPQPGRLVA
jgi:hypothetical protein